MAPCARARPPDDVTRRPVELVLARGFVDCFRELDPGERGWTYLTGHPWARIDFVFASSGLSAGRCEVVAAAGAASDHFPVVAEIETSSRN